MLAGDICIVGEQLRTCGAPEAVQHVGTGAFDEMPNLESTGTRFARRVGGVGIDFAAGLFEYRIHPPRERQKGADLGPRVGVPASQ